MITTFHPWPLRHGQRIWDVNAVQACCKYQVVRLEDVFTMYDGAVADTKGRILSTTMTANWSPTRGHSPAIPGDMCCITRLAWLRSDLFEMIQQMRDTIFVLPVSVECDTNWVLECWPTRKLGLSELPGWMLNDGIIEFTQCVRYPNIYIALEVYNQFQLDQLSGPLSKLKDLCGVALQIHAQEGMDLQLGKSEERQEDYVDRADLISWVIIMGGTVKACEEVVAQCKEAKIPVWNETRGSLRELPEVDCKDAQ